MSESFEASRNASEEASDEMVGAHFIDLEEILHVSEEQPLESEKDINEREELRRIFHQAETSCRQQRELHDQMFGHGLEIEAFINKTAAENKYLTSKVKEFQQQLANKRKMREEEDEEALSQELLFKEESIVKSQSIYIRKMEKENQKLREKNEDLTAELDQLSLGEKYQEEIQNLRSAEQEFKHKLEEVQEVLRIKDEEIEKKSMTLIKKNYEIQEYFNTVKDLRQDQQELREQLCSRQEDQILAAVNFQEESNILSEKRQPLVSLATDEEHEDERLLKTENWWWKGVKVAGAIALCVLFLVGIMASMVPVCNSPDADCNLSNIAFELLEPYSELHHTLPPVY